MLLWLLFALMTAGVLAVILRPLTREASRASPDQAADVRVDLSPSWEVADDGHELRWLVAPGDPEVTVTCAVTPVAWGRLSLGSVAISLARPGGLVEWGVTAALPRSFRVLPPPERVRELLPPPQKPSAGFGMHPARTIGDGFDFAELRPFQPGDRLRDINWRASGRAETPQVNRRHPERNGDVVLLLDTFADSWGLHSETMHAVLGRTGRAAWSIAQLHLAAQDRVGLTSVGQTTRHLRVGGGDRARYTLLQALLDIGGDIAAIAMEATRVRTDIANNALVVVLTPLEDSRMSKHVLALRSEGRRVVVVVVEVMDLLPPARDHTDAVARRLYAAQLHVERDRLAATGVPLTVWTDDSSLGLVIGALRHLQHVTLVRR